MKRRNKGILYTALVLASLAVILLYLYARTGQTNAIKTEAAAVSAENLRLSRQKAEPGISEKMIPEKAGIALFVENLYDAARLSGIKKHAVSTVKTGDVPAQKNAAKGAAAESDRVLKTYSLKISLEGNYRETAEYIREVQNIERFKRITELGMKPSDTLIKTEITIEIFSLGGKDAAQ